jgi:hypothetical protein
LVKEDSAQRYTEEKHEREDEEIALHLPSVFLCAPYGLVNDYGVKV